MGVVKANPHLDSSSRTVASLTGSNSESREGKKPLEIGWYTHNIHMTLHRSKVDCPQLEEMATVSFDGAVLRQIPASMSYLCVGSSGKADKKKKKGKDAKVVAYLSDKEIFYVEDKVGGVQLWDSFSHPSNTILLEQMLGFDSKSGTKNVMTSWKRE